MTNTSDLLTRLDAIRNRLLDTGDYSAHHADVVDATTIGEASAAIRALEVERDAARAGEDAAREDAERYRWLRANVSFYDVDADWPVEGHNIPTLAQVCNRIWYHGTDDTQSSTLDELCDLALARYEQRKQERK